MTRIARNAVAEMICLTLLAAVGVGVLIGAAQLPAPCSSHLDPRDCRGISAGS